MDKKVAQSVFSEFLIGLPGMLVLFFVTDFEYDLMAYYFGVYCLIFFSKFLVHPKQESYFLKPSYHVAVRVHDSDGNPATDAVVRCSSAARPDKIGDAWYFTIQRADIPFNLRLKFHAYIPSSGQWGEMEHTFWRNDQPVLDISLKDESTEFNPVTC